MEQKIKQMEQLFTDFLNNVKKELENITPKEPVTITDFNDIETYEQCCAIADEPIALPFPEAVTDNHNWLNACHQIYVITRAYNGKKLPDWDNTNEKKWWPVFDMRISGFVFLGSYYDWTITVTDGGSRFAFITKDRCDKAAKQFLPIFEVLFKK